MSLENLARIGQIEPITPDPADIHRLLDSAQRSLADAALPGLSSEGRFDMAYKAIMQSANAALQSKGFRTLTSKPGHDQAMIQTLPLTVGLDRTTTIQLDALRKQRNVIDYSGDIVSYTMATEAVQHASELFMRVRNHLESLCP